MQSTTPKSSQTEKKKALPVHGFFPGMISGFFIGLIVPMFVIHLLTRGTLDHPQRGYVFIVIAGMAVFLVWPIFRRLGRLGAWGFISGMLIIFGIRFLLRGAMTSGFGTLFESHFYYIEDCVAAIFRSTDLRRSAELDHAAAQGVAAAFNDTGGTFTILAATLSALTLHIWFVCRIFALLKNRWFPEAEREWHSNASAKEEKTPDQTQEF